MGFVFFYPKISRLQTILHDAARKMRSNFGKRFATARRLHEEQSHIGMVT